MAFNSVWCLQHLSTPSTDKHKWQNDREGLHFLQNIMHRERYSNVNCAEMGKGTKGCRISIVGSRICYYRYWISNKRCRIRDLAGSPQFNPCFLQAEQIPMLTDCTSVSIALSQLVRGRPQGLLQWLGGRSDAPMTQWWSCLGSTRATCPKKEAFTHTLVKNTRNVFTSASQQRAVYVWTTHNTQWKHVLAGTGF